MLKRYDENQFTNEEKEDLLYWVNQYPSEEEYFSSEEEYTHYLNSMLIEWVLDEDVDSAIDNKEIEIDENAQLTYIMEKWTGSSEEKNNLNYVCFKTVTSVLDFIDTLEESEGYQVTEVKIPYEEATEDPSNWLDWSSKGLIKHECMDKEELIEIL